MSSSASSQCDKVVSPPQKQAEPTPTIEALDQAFVERARAADVKQPRNRIDTNSLRQIVYRNYSTLESLFTEKNFDYDDLATLLKEHYKLQECESNSVRKYMSDARKAKTVPPSSPTTKRSQQNTKPERDQSPSPSTPRDPRKNAADDSQSAMRQDFNR